MSNMDKTPAHEIPETWEDVYTRSVCDASYPVHSLGVLAYLIPRSVYAEKKADTEAVIESHHPAYFLAWPPNLFAATSMIFEVTGCYSRISWDWSFRTDAARRGDILNHARQWKNNLKRLKSENDFDFLESRGEDPPETLATWQDVMKYFTPDVVKSIWTQYTQTMDPSGEGNTHDLWTEEHSGLTRDLLLLHAIADATCEGWGVRRMKGQPSAAFGKACRLLETYGSLATIHPDRARVLPKRHTPQVGMTIRSLSLSLAFHRSSIRVNWRTSGTTIIDASGASEGSRYTKSSAKAINVLLCPWPSDIKPIQFSPNPVDHMLRRGTFTYSAISRGDAVGNDRMRIDERLRSAIREAKKEFGDVDITILPELSLRQIQLDDVKRVIKDESIPVCISGVMMHKDSGGYSRNAVWKYFLSRERSYEEGFQDKHHPWHLDEKQIRNYQLSSILSPNVRWIEDLRIRRLTSSFLNLGNELTICAVICEDLARQDQLAELIRAVGPSLVVAILMDGPQLKHRWAARYANVLGDDPGCAVLSLTSLGMAKLSNPRGLAQPNQSRSIALWSDGTGEMREIELDDRHDAVVLSLPVHEASEATTDGRIEHRRGNDKSSQRGTFSLQYGGYRQVSIVKA